MSEKEENLVKKTCKELGITQKELAERIGLNEVSISRWSNGAKIPLNSQKHFKLLSEFSKLKIELDVLKRNCLGKN